MSTRGHDDRASLAPPAESIPPPAVVPKDAERPAPLVRSIAPPAAPASGAAGAPGTTATATATATAAVGGRLHDPAPLLALTVAVVGAVDFIVPLVLWASIPLSLALTGLVVPWGVLTVREATGGTAALEGDKRRAQRHLFFHFANIALVLAFLAAKWLTLVDALGGADHAASVGAYRNYTIALVVLLVVGAVLRGGRVARFFAANADHPARLMVGSFGLASIAGALLLALPVSLRDPSHVSLVDSLFVSVSAVCVTGLSPVTLTETYTPAGQAIICGLVQIGGLGIMVITAGITILAGRRLGVKGSAALAEMVDSRSLRDVQRTVGLIVTYTLLFEAIGAALLYWQFEGGPPVASDVDARWAAVFYAVSSFCNAGIALSPDNLVPLAARPGICFTISALVVAGSIGFPVMHELIFRTKYAFGRRRAPRLTLNTRVTLATSAMMLAGMTLAYLVLENGASFSDLGIVGRLDAALVQSASTRSAGFNTVDIGRMRPATLLLTCFAMFVGGGAGSIAGGIKVTTLAVLFAAFRAELRGQTPRLFDRALPQAVVRRAMGISFLATLVVAVVVFVLLLLEEHEPLALVFEAVAAFSTAGMSTGITPKLGVAAKIVLVLTMLIGRIGPLTAAYALAARARSSHYQLPEERVMIG